MVHFDYFLFVFRTFEGLLFFILRFWKYTRCIFFVNFFFVFHLFFRFSKFCPINISISAIITIVGATSFKSAFLWKCKGVTLSWLWGYSAQNCAHLAPYALRFGRQNLASFHGFSALCCAFCLVLRQFRAVYSKMIYTHLTGRLAPLYSCWGEYNPRLSTFREIL